MNASSVSSVYDRVDPDELRASRSVKWTRHDPDVLPLWVADMDFPAHDAIREALAADVREQRLGYPPEATAPELVEALLGRLEARFGWRPNEPEVRATPGTVSAIFQCVAALASPGETALVPTPAYPPFLFAARKQSRPLREVPLASGDDGYRLDADAVAEAVTPGVRVLVLCNPHNPTGRCFTRAELEAVAEVVLEHRLWVVSDELHADLRYGAEHIPFASLSPEVARRTVTLYGPTKAFNVAGLTASAMLSENRELIERVAAPFEWIARPPNISTQIAAATALGSPETQRWFEATLDYLAGNRRRVAEVVADWDAVRWHAPEGTYLAWLDLRALELGERPSEAILERARVALTDGADFGEAGAGFVRLNFATSRAILDEALERLGGVLG